MAREEAVRVFEGQDVAQGSQGADPRYLASSRASGSRTCASESARPSRGRDSRPLEILLLAFGPEDHLAVIGPPVLLDFLADKIPAV